MSDDDMICVNGAEWEVQRDDSGRVRIDLRMNEELFRRVFRQFSGNSKAETIRSALDAAAYHRESNYRIMDIERSLAEAHEPLAETMEEIRGLMDDGNVPVEVVDDED